MSVGAVHSDLGEELLLQVAEEADLALLRRNVANRLLQREHRLRALQRIEAQAPIDHLEHVIRILAGPDLLRRDEVVLLLARVGSLRRERRKAGEHARAHAVDVGPRTEPVGIAVLLGCGEARRVHRRELRAFRGERLTGGAEVEQHGAAVGAQIDIRRFDVEMKELVRVHLAQPVQQVHEHVAHEPLGHLVLAHLDLLLQRAPALVAHDHVDGFIGSKEIEHAHDVRVRDLRERAAFLEEALHSVTKRRHVLGGRCADDVAFRSKHERRRQVFLDRDGHARLVECPIDDRESAATDLPIDPIVEELIPAGEGLIGDGHGRR